MSNVSSLFCTPAQGQRLKELVPGLTSAFVWYVTPNMKKLHQNRSNGCQIGDQNTPALTLQELRDVAKGKLGSGIVCMDTDEWDFNVKLQTMTAKEFAAWVIERLEEVGNVRE